MELKNVGIYVRVSTERQVQAGYSISAQKENLINFAKSHDFKIYDIYADEGISGKNIEGRPDVKRLIQDIKERRIDIVLLQRFDRLTRSISDTQEFIDLFKEFNVLTLAFSSFDNSFTIFSDNAFFFVFSVSIALNKSSCAFVILFLKPSDFAIIHSPCH